MRLHHIMLSCMFVIGVYLTVQLLMKGSKHVGSGVCCCHLTDGYPELLENDDVTIPVW